MLLFRSNFIGYGRLVNLLLTWDVVVLFDLDRSLGRMVQGTHVVVVHLWKGEIWSRH